MSAVMVEPVPGRKPGDTDMHRRQRTKNLVVFGLLLAMAAVFFALTVVRMGGKS